jgi:hypothetical protein
VPDLLVDSCPGVLVATGLGGDQQIPPSTASGWDHMSAAGIDGSVGLIDRTSYDGGNPRPVRAKLNAPARRCRYAGPLTLLSRRRRHEQRPVLA